MIRLVDVLKKAGEWKVKPEPAPEQPKEKKEEKAEKEPLRIAALVKRDAVEKLTADKTKKLFDEIVRGVNLILTKGKGSENPSESGAAVVSCLGKIVDQEMIGNQELIPVLDRDFRSNKTLKVIYYAIKLGRDADYERGRMIDLAATALVQEIESSVESGKWDVRLLRTAISRQAKIGDEADKGLIALAEIYVNK